MANNEKLDAKFVLIDDAWSPVLPTVRKWFLEYAPNSHILTTTYRRSQMLLGGENFTGQCEAFADAAEMTEADILVKIDCDTLLFKSDWLEQFADDDKALVAGAFDYAHNCHFSVFGFIYALKASILDQLSDDAKTYPAHHHAWEDHEVSMRVFRLAGGRIDSMLRWRPSPQDGFVVQPLNKANDTFVYARATTFAWDYQATPEDEKPSFRAKVGAMMKRLNDINEGIIVPAKEAEAKEAK